MADYDFALPSLGADMERATILEWRIGPGDEVRRGDVVAVIDTEKSEIDLEIWHGGTVTEIVVAEGEEVPVGTVLARLIGVVDAPGTAAPAPSAPTAAPPAPVRAPAGADASPGPTTPSPAPTSSPTAPSHHGAGPQVWSPLVRHLAEAAHVDLGRVTGTGPGGRITREDVERTARARGPAPVVRASPLARRLARERGVDLKPLSGSGPQGAVLAGDVPETRPTTSRGDAMRRAVAALMARSKREIPHYYLAQDVDVGAAMEWMAAANEERPPAERLLSAALLLKATARAATAHPELNGFWIEGRFEPSEAVHLGVAVALRGGGLIAPALLDAADRPLEDLMAGLRDLVSRARGGRLRSAEMSQATITVTSLGDRGPDLVHGVIYPPQVALVGFGRIAERPAVVDGNLAVRPMVTVTLSGDHRATDGDRGARMLATIDRLLQEPEEL